MVSVIFFLLYHHPGLRCRGQVILFCGRAVFGKAVDFCAGAGRLGVLLPAHWGDAARRGAARLASSGARGKIARDVMAGNKKFPARLCPAARR
jgi:hypothetical protein